MLKNRAEKPSLETPEAIEFFFQQLLLHFFEYGKIISNADVLHPLSQDELYLLPIMLRDFLRASYEEGKIPVLVWNGLPGSGKTSEAGETLNAVEASGYFTEFTPFDEVRKMLMEFFGARTSLWKIEWLYLAFLQLRQFFSGVSYPENVEDQRRFLKRDYSAFLAGIDRNTLSDDSEGEQEMVDRVIALLEGYWKPTFSLERLLSLLEMEYPGQADVKGMDRGRWNTRILIRMMETNNSLVEDLNFRFIFTLADDEVRDFAKLVRRHIVSLHESRPEFRKLLEIIYINYRLKILGQYPFTRQSRIGETIPVPAKVVRAVAKAFDAMANEQFIDDFRRQALQQADHWRNESRENEEDYKNVSLSPYTIWPARARDELRSLAAFSAFRDKHHGLAEKTIVVRNPYLPEGILSLDLGLPRFRVLHKIRHPETQRLITADHPRFYEIDMIDPDVVFICENNVGRGQAAEALFNLYTGSKKAVSMGSDIDTLDNYRREFQGRPGPRIMQSINRWKNETTGARPDFSAQWVKPLNERLLKKAKTIVVLCDSLKCPELFAEYADKIIYAPVDDPKGKPEAEFRRIMSQIDRIVVNLIQGKIKVNAQGQPQIRPSYLKVS